MFPAAAARAMGLGDVPLLCARELDVVGSTPRCLRVLVHVTTDTARGSSTTSTSTGPGGCAMTSPSDARRAAVVGTGLIGGSIGLALRARGWRVTGRDADPAAADRAMALGALDAVGEDPDAEVTFVATPLAAVAAEVHARPGRRVRRPDAVVTDVAGVKAPGGGAPSTDPRFVGGHPMAGSEQVGRRRRRPDLFVGATWVLTPTADTDPDAYARLQAVVTSLGAEVVALSPEQHDALVAVVSHVPHLTAATLMNLADRAAEEHAALLRLAAGGFRDMTRIAAGQPGIWPDVCAENAAAIVAALDALLADLAAMRDRVAAGDRAGLLAVLEHAAAARRSLPSRAVRPERLAELRVPVPDRPGVLAEITTLAGDLGVNIDDLEIAHSAEGDRGVLVLVVDADGAERAARRPHRHAATARRRAARVSASSGAPAPASASPWRAAAAGGHGARCRATSPCRTAPCSWRRWPRGVARCGGCPTATTWPAPPPPCAPSGPTSTSTGDPCQRGARTGWPPSRPAARHGQLGHHHAAPGRAGGRPGLRPPVLGGDASLSTRPMDRVAVPLRLHGGRRSRAQGERCLPPLTIRGGALRGIDYTPPMAERPGEVVRAAGRAAGRGRDRRPRAGAHPPPHRGAAGPLRGAPSSEDEDGDGAHVVRLRPVASSTPFELDVPGDPSQAAFWVVAACIVPGQRRHRASASTSGRDGAGYLDVLARMGADVDEVRGHRPRRPGRHRRHRGPPRSRCGHRGRRPPRSPASTRSRCWPWRPPAPRATPCSGTWGSCG